MTKKRKICLAISTTAACITVLCAVGACNGVTKEEKAVRRVIVTAVASTSQTTNSVSTTTQPTSTAPMTTTATTTAVTITAPQITTAGTCSATEQGLGETTPPTTTTEQTTAADTTVQMTTTSTAATTTAPTPAEPYHGQTSGDYIYVNGFGWVFNEGGGGYGETNYDMYCNGNKIGYLHSLSPAHTMS